MRTRLCVCVHVRVCVCFACGYGSTQVGLPVLYVRISVPEGVCLPYARGSGVRRE